MKTIPASLFLLCSLLLLYACKKTVEASMPPPAGPVGSNSDSIPQTVQAVPYPQTVVIDCPYAPDYGDSVVFPQPAGGTDYIVSPVNNQGVSGSYLSWPAGLSINSSTGSIDITRSVSGVRYNIGFVKSGTTDTCLSALIVGGASYADSVYVLSKSDTSAEPYFNANPYGPQICDGSGPDDGNYCQFDLYDNAKNQGIIIDKKTGFIDLRKSMNSGMFGVLPLDGEIVNATFYYKLSDASNNAVQQMQIQFQYYTNKSQVPAGLIGLIGGKLTNILNDILIAKTGSPKPPLIIITRN
jgi:hypothetical protein